MSSPRIFAHRGAPAVLPESTLEGFAYALEAGACGLEVDILLTRDGIPAVTHNPRLLADTTRGPDGRWLNAEGPAIASLTFAELQAYDIGAARPGSPYAAKHPHQQRLDRVRIPSLDDVLALVADCGRPAELLIELKHSPAAPGQPEPADFVRRVAETVARHGLTGQSHIHAFNWQILTAAAEAAPDLRRSHLSIRRGTHPDGTVYAGSPWLDGASHEPAAMLRALSRRGATVWSPYYQDLDSASLTLAQGLGLQVMTWTINGSEALETELRTGVDGIITDDPALAVALRAAARQSGQGRTA